MNPAIEAVKANNPEADSLEIVNAYSYLAHYGYLAGAVIAGAATPFLAVASIAAAITEFQQRAGIPVTGEIDAATKDMMAAPRCGVLDVQRIGVQEDKWRKNRLTYFTQDHVSGLSTTDQDSIIATAFQQWSDVADIQATPAPSADGADIIISIGRGQAQGFDGPSGTLAWAYLPTGNDAQLLMRFDADETWVTSGNGIHMLNVACHEFGHLLGLDHSKNSGALMAPFYAPAISKPQQNDDITRMQALYGPAIGGPVVPPPVPKRQVISFEIEGKLTAVSIPGYKVIPA